MNVKMFFSRILSDFSEVDPLQIFQFTPLANGSFPKIVEELKYGCIKGFLVNIWAFSFFPVHNKIGSIL